MTENSIFCDNVDPTPSVIDEYKTSPRGSLTSDKYPNVIVKNNEKTKSGKESLQNLDV